MRISNSGCRSDDSKSLAANRSCQDRCKLLSYHCLNDTRNELPEFRKSTHSERTRLYNRLTWYNRNRIRNTHQIHNPRPLDVIFIIIRFASSPQNVRSPALPMNIKPLKTILYISKIKTYTTTIISRLKCRVTHRIQFRYTFATVTRQSSSQI